MEHFHNLIANIRARTRDTNFMLHRHYISIKHNQTFRHTFKWASSVVINYKHILHNYIRQAGKKYRDKSKNGLMIKTAYFVIRKPLAMEMRFLYCWVKASLTRCVDSEFHSPAIWIAKNDKILQFVSSSYTAWSVEI